MRAFIITAPDRAPAPAPAPSRLPFDALPPAARPRARPPARLPNAQLQLQQQPAKTTRAQYLWLDHRGHYHALTHKNVAGAVAGHMWSADGLAWRMSRVPPYGDTLALVGGGQYQCQKRARPMLLVEGGRPRSLSTGAGYATADGNGTGTADHTVTTMQEVNGKGR
jgi:hypothetical protein